MGLVYRHSGALAVFCSLSVTSRFYSNFPLMFRSTLSLPALMATDYSPFNDVFVMHIRWSSIGQRILSGAANPIRNGNTVAAYNETGQFVSSGYLYDNHRGRARVPLNQRRSSIPYEASAYEGMRNLFFDANRFWAIPDERSSHFSRVKPDKRGAWHAR